MKKKKKSKRMKSPKRFVRKSKLIDHEEFLLEQLKNPKYAATYIEECISESGSDRIDLILDAFRLVVKAHGFSRLAQISGVSRRTLYKAFSEDGNPTVETLFAMLEAAGLTFSVKPQAELLKKRA